MQEENQKQNIDNSANSEPVKDELFKENLKPLRTYQGDVEKIMGENKVSVATVAIAEQKRKYEERDHGIVVDDSGLKNKIFISLGIFLFVAGIATVGSIYFLKSKNDPLKNLSLQTTLINYTSKTDINFDNTDRENIISTIIKERNNFTGKLNLVLYLNFTSSKGAPNAGEVLSEIAPSIPQTLVRSLDKQYMFGVYSYDKNTPFIILTTKDYGSSFAGMLKWEGSMISDIGEIFDIPRNGTTTTYAFTDDSIQNKDMRVVKDSNRKNIFVYSFIDKNTIVITKNEQILIRVFDKFINSKMVR